MEGNNPGFGPVNWWKKQSIVLRFSLSFAIGMLLFYLLYLTPFYQNTFLPAFVNFQSEIAGAILNLLGYGVKVDGSSIANSEFSVSVANGCDGMESIALLGVAISVFPLSFKLKWPGLIIGVVVLLFLNILRIAGLFLSGIHFPSAFELLHTHGGFVLFTSFSILLVIFWISWAIRKKKAEDV